MTKTPDPTIPWMARQIELWPLERLVPYDRNPKTHPEEQLRAIEAMVREVGFTNPILVDGDDGIVAGHARLKVAQRMGLTEVPVVVMDHLTPDQKRAYVVADNRLAEMGKWDTEILAAELEAIQLGPIDLAAVGFTEGELEAMKGERLEVTVPEETKAAKRPRPRKKRVRAGEVWQLGAHRLAVADCTDASVWSRLFEDTEPASMIFTDPPYEISYKSGAGAKVRNDDLRASRLIDFLQEAFGTVGACTRENAAWYVWHGDRRLEFDTALARAGLEELGYIVWAKPSPGLGQAHYRPAHEGCLYAVRSGKKPGWYGGRTEGTCWRVTAVADGVLATTLGAGLCLVGPGGSQLFLSPNVPAARSLRRLDAALGQTMQVTEDPGGLSSVWEVSRDTQTVHPTQKPVELAVRALKNSTRPGEVVADGFLGGGCTLLGAEATGRIFRGCELDPTYAGLAIERWEHLVGAEAVRIEDAPRPVRRKKKKAAKKGKR